MRERDREKVRAFGKKLEHGDCVLLNQNENTYAEQRKEKRERKRKRREEEAHPAITYRL